MINVKVIVLFAAVSVLVVIAAGLVFAHPANAQTTSPTNALTQTPQGTNGANPYSYPQHGYCYGTPQGGYPYCYGNGYGRGGCGCGCGW